MNISDIVDKSEELVEIVDSLLELTFKDKQEYIKKNLVVTKGSIWSYNNNPGYTCTVKSVYENALDVMMCAKWTGIVHYDVLIKGFFENNFTEVLVFERYN